VGAGGFDRSGPDELVRWVLLRLSDGRELLLAKRTYREGNRLVVDPSEGELQQTRRDPSTAWNSKRSELVASIDDLRVLASG
jgi:hypothetical protein